MFVIKSAICFLPVSLDPGAQIFQTCDNIFGTCWQQVCEGVKVVVYEMDKRLFATPNKRKSKQEYSIIIELKFKESDYVPVALCTVQQCGFFLETGFRVNGLDIIVFGNHFFWSFLCILLGIRTQTYRNPTYFLFRKVSTQTLATLDSFLPFFSDLLGF